MTELLSKNSARKNYTYTTTRVTLFAIYSAECMHMLLNLTVVITTRTKISHYIAAAFLLDLCLGLNSHYLIFIHGSLTVLQGVRRA